VTALRLSKLLDPSPLLRAVPEVAAKRRSKPPMVLVPTTTRRFNASVILATMTSAANVSATAVTSQPSAPAQTATAPATAPARCATLEAKIPASIAAEKAANTAMTMSALTMMILIEITKNIAQRKSPEARARSDQRNPELHTKAGRAREIKMMMKNANTAIEE
jgi:hypothetical protein